MSEIDVSKCSFFANENCIYDRKKILNCEDCFYQQLQRLKQENEKLDKLEKICTENLKNGTKITNLDVLEIIGRNEK